MISVESRLNELSIAFLRVRKIELLPDSGNHDSQVVPRNPFNIKSTAVSESEGERRCRQLLLFQFILAPHIFRTSNWTGSEGLP